QLFPVRSRSHDPRAGVRTNGERSQSSCGLRSKAPARVECSARIRSQSLALPTGKSHAALAHSRVIPLGQPLDELICVRLLAGGHDLLKARVGFSETNVFENGAAEEESLLINNAHRFTK